MSRSSPDLSYYMPLSNGASPKDGPSKSIFSVPSFNYSPETHKIVKTLMNESKLTHTQKTGFQSILRQGNHLPTRPSDVYRQEIFKVRHAEKARSYGLPVMNPAQFYQMPRRANYSMRFNSGGRRTFDTIRSSGELEHTIQTRRYIPCDKEKEKVRFAHRMAFGVDPPPENRDGLIKPRVVGLKNPNKTSKSYVSLMDERFFELVQEIEDRVDFLDSMIALGNGKEYRASIIPQIQDLVAEMKKISADKANDCIKMLKLDKLDKCFVEGGYKFENNLFRHVSQEED